jgi:hypothetical protein
MDVKDVKSREVEEVSCLAKFFLFYLNEMI